MAIVLCTPGVIVKCSIIHLTIAPHLAIVKEEEKQEETFLQTIATLADNIIDGLRLATSDACQPLLTAPLEALMEGADRIRQAMRGNRVELCAIINGRSGRCGENCKFCAQSVCNHTGIEEYGFVPQEEILADCGTYDALGVDRYSIVTAGRGLSAREMDKAVDAYAAMRREYPGIGLCASHGFMSEEAFRRLRDAGVSRVHCNIETSEEFFPEICTSHRFADKLENIYRAKRAGLDICCGGIIGMGESWQDRISMALTIQKIGAVSVPLNVLIPIPGTPLADRPVMAEEDVLRTVALFRFIVPEADVRIAAGRFRFQDGGLSLFQAGASATITGNMLTTVGNNTKQDREMLTAAGYSLRPVGTAIPADTEPALLAASRGGDQRGEVL